LVSEVRGVGSSGPGRDEDAFAFVGGADVAGAKTAPARIHPERGQVAEYGSECPQMRLVAAVSQTPRAGFHVAVGSGTAQSSNVLDDDQGRAQGRDGEGDVCPQAGRCSGDDARASSGHGHALAGEPRQQHLHRLDRAPSGGGDVAEVGRVGVVVGEQGGGCGVGVGDPRHAAAQHR
jgi:hypothetical protein